MATFYAPQSQGFQGLNIGEILARGQRYRAGEQAMRRSQAEEDQLSQIRPLETLGRQLALRGQLLGSVETPEDYAAILPTIQAAGLPMADLPEDRRSTASQTFRRPEVPATSQARAAWMPDFGAPMAPTALPSGELAAQGIAPEDVPTIQRRAQAGLPLQTQQKFQDADVGRQIQLANLSRVQDKDALSREWMAFQREAKVQGMNEAEAQREFQRKMALMGYGLDEKRFQLSEKAAQREAAKPTINEGQAKAILFGQEVAASLVDFEDLLGKGFDPTGLKGTADVALSGMGFGSEDAKIWNNASDQLAQAALRFESGAAIGEQEFGKKIRANVPKFGDSPAVVRRKLDAIRRAKEAFESYTGKTFRSTAAGGAKPAASSIPTVSSQAAYDALPPGSQYKAPDGRILTKKAR